jgi:hypothetical protein
MYYFYFSKGSVYLPNKKSENLPTIISCYGLGEGHWQKRVEEDVRRAVNKNNIGFVTFRDQSAQCMAEWVGARNFADSNRIGLFTFGEYEANDLAFSITTLPLNTKPELNTKIPTLFLQGTSDKVTLESFALAEDELERQENPDTGSASILFKGGDEFLYNVSKQAAGEIVKWLKSLFTKSLT